jgi:hypothetical protein
VTSKITNWYTCKNLWCPRLCIWWALPWSEPYCESLCSWTVKQSHKTRHTCQAPVAHTCNPSYSGGRVQEDHGLKPAPASSCEALTQKYPSHKKAGGSRWRPWVQAPVLQNKKTSRHTGSRTDTCCPTSTGSSCNPKLFLAPCHFIENKARLLDSQFPSSLYIMSICICFFLSS